ncbi:DUF2064 domain-containing protein [Flavobacterium frigoris]|uniref:Glycosyltransferase n=1 Tax=Flavobacterium frigoris (strain PS1) TaxID=1086011 RepID=H7FS49_FLAFP|nr:DUF2064 domain-containing protein [Flavobacterium frigoris]EIA08546.1 hypothetical protein HJ01_02268 [Flavobacterium frigoris PS1]
MNLDCKHSLSTAILLFAQSDQVESAVKPIAYQKKQNDLLWQKMNQKVIQTIHKTNLPYFISDEKTQVGQSFGDKLSHAIQLVFDKGFEKVIVVGNDSPGLTVTHFKNAQLGLENKKWVFGPDRKGGTYLIGVSKSVFNAALFAKISWCTNQVAAQLKALSFKESTILSPLADLNTIADFKNILKGFSFYSTFKNYMLSMLSYQHPINRVLKKRYCFEIVGFNFNKGSPIME